MRDERTLVVGLGNPLLGDDGVGWNVVAALADSLVDPAPSVELDCLAVGGLTLMERLAGFDRAILVDALVTGRDAPGTLTVCPLDELAERAAAHLDSAHDAPIGAALEAGRALGACLPDEILVVGIEAERVDTFGEALSAAVAAAVPTAVDRVVRLIEAPTAGAVKVAPRRSPAEGPNASGRRAEGPPRARRPALVRVSRGPEAVLQR
jgi:hydrogenase maturation protease